MLILRRDLLFRLVLWGCALTAGIPVASSQNAFNINMQAVASSTVFIHVRDKNGELQEAGTGFLLAVPSKSQSGRYYYILVTARHIADPTWAHCEPRDGSLLGVFNLKSTDPNRPGEAAEALLGDGWAYPSDDSADVAVIGLYPPAMEAAHIENVGLITDILATPGDTVKLDTGSPVVSAGFLLGASGQKRNYPIFKFGYISSRPLEKISVACTKGGATREMTEWMIAASLVSGNSGSPIFFTAPTISGIRDPRQPPLLIGVQSASFEGSDVAGMAPVEYVVDALQNLNFANDLDLTRFGLWVHNRPATTTSGSVKPNPIPIEKK